MQIDISTDQEKKEKECAERLAQATKEYMLCICPDFTLANNITADMVAQAVKDAMRYIISF